MFAAMLVCRIESLRGQVDPSRKLAFTFDFSSSFFMFTVTLTKGVNSLINDFGPIFIFYKGLKAVRCLSYLLLNFMGKYML